MDVFSEEQYYRPEIDCMSHDRQCRKNQRRQDAPSKELELPEVGRPGEYFNDRRHDDDDEPSPYEAGPARLEVLPSHRSKEGV